MWPAMKNTTLFRPAVVKRLPTSTGLTLSSCLTDIPSNTDLAAETIIPYHRGWEGGSQIAHIVTKASFKISDRERTECRQLNVDMTYAHWLKMAARLGLIPDLRPSPFFTLFL